MSRCSAPGAWEGVAASAEAAPVARHVLGGRRWQRRPRVGWRAAYVQAVVGLVRLDAAEALPPVSAVLTRPPCRRGVREGHRRRGEPPACPRARRAPLTPLRTGPRVS